MKKSFYILISLSLCAGVLFTSCSFSNPSDKESTEENIDIITEPGVTHSGNADATVPVNNGEVTPSVNTEPSTDESSSEEVTYVGTLVGYTSKNYPISEKDGITYAIQCKCYSNNVGNDAVHQALAGKQFYKRDIAVVLTNQYFTTQAKEEASVFGVKLWDRNKLDELVQNINN